jgi:hypothetical protein
LSSSGFIWPPKNARYLEREKVEGDATSRQPAAWPCCNSGEPSWVRTRIGTTSPKTAEAGGAGVEAGGGRRLSWLDDFVKPDAPAEYAPADVDNGGAANRPTQHPKLAQAAPTEKLAASSMEAAPLLVPQGQEIVTWRVA